MAAPPVKASSTFVSRLREDVVGGLGSVLFTSVLGAALMPRAARRVLLNAAGAQVESGPGTAFSLNGSARNLRIGRGVYFNTRVDIEAVAPVTIGAHTAIGMQVLIMTSHHAIDPDGGWSTVAKGRAVTIGERVWIGGRATILPGARIDDDVVIAAGAVVTGHLQSHGVYAGVPARRIRELARPTPAPGPSEPESVTTQN
ncbi:acyltransferase [Curtobacterium sp. VKM Ac-2865]|uniref:acyltransferase n=1 Tax=Curtobacterium sp. VKM Ac-2865 TaxID=2783817 RepID=UPI00188CB603|nr:DapH/DapD/GlmU-related protein [Curtobacterium sp. VKM Ac-2865]MBF4583827.1 acyltransferase [Curtobacterium sp. VKM Ac-2865]